MYVVGSCVEKCNQFRNNSSCSKICLRLMMMMLSGELGMQRKQQDSVSRIVAVSGGISSRNFAQFMGDERETV